MNNNYDIKNGEKLRRLIVEHIEGAPNFEGILLDLSRTDQHDAEEALIKLLDDPDTDVVGEATALLMKISPNRGKRALLRLLDHPNSVLRYVAIRQLGEHYDDSLFDSFQKVLFTDEDENVRYNASVVLGYFGTPNVIDLLEQVARLDYGVDYEGRPISEAAQTSIKKIQKRFHDI